MGILDAPARNPSTFKRLESYGHSYVESNFSWPAGVDQRFSTLLAAMLGASEVNYGLGGAMVASPDGGATPGAGGWVRVMQKSAATRTRTAAPYLPGCDIALLVYGVNDLRLAATYSTTGDITQQLVAVKEAMRSCLSRIRAGGVWEAETSPSGLVTAGGWTVNAAAGTNGSSGTGFSFLSSGATSATVTWTVPADFPGTPAVPAVAFVVPYAMVGTIAWTVDGVSAGTTTLTGTSELSAGVNSITKRFPGLTAGSHTIVGTVSKTAATGLLELDFVQIESPTPPLVLVPLQPALSASLSYSGYTEANRLLLNAALVALCAEFDSNVVPVSFATALNNAGDTPAGVDLTMFRGDLLHPSEKGNATIAAALYEAAMRAPTRHRAGGVGRVRARGTVVPATTLGSVVGYTEIALRDGTVGYVPVYGSIT